MERVISQASSTPAATATATSTMTDRRVWL